MKGGRERQVDGRGGGGGGGGRREGGVYSLHESGPVWPSGKALSPFLK